MLTLLFFFFVDSSNILQSILFETLQSPETVSPQGSTDYGLGVPGIVLQYYKNV